MKGTQLYMTLEAAIKHMYHYGKYDEFNKDGLPSVSRVRNLMGDNSITRDQIDNAWHALYGYSTCRFSQRHGKK